MIFSIQPFIGNLVRFGAALAVFLFFAPSILSAQSLDSAQTSHRAPAPATKIKIRSVPQSTFIPTCNLDSNSVGFYFFPPNVGAKWTIRTISQVFDLQNTLLKCDTTYSYERIVSDSNRTLQGLPVIDCKSSFPYRLGMEDSAKTKDVEYYVDDSIVMTVFNHSMASDQNHILLEEPLDSGHSWKDVPDDTTYTTVIATDEPVTTAMGDYPHSLVVQTPAGFGTMSKYFVKGVGIVKIIFRGIPPQQNGTFVVTSELSALDHGDPTRSIKYRFAGLRRRSAKSKTTKRKVTSQ